MELVDLEAKDYMSVKLRLVMELVGLVAKATCR